MRVLTLLVLATLVSLDSLSSAHPQSSAVTSQPPTAPAGQLPATASQPRDQRQTPPAASGVIRGRVVSADTGEALRRVRVDLSASELKSARAVATDGNGRFEFRGLPAGRFLVRASKTGYVTLAYGQRRPFQGGRQVELTAGEVAEDVSIALPRGAVIAGRIMNDVGEPVADFRASAFRLRYRAGRREVSAVGQSGRTNDLGEFRISRLPPGTYFVGTAGGLQASSTTVEEGLTLAPSFHPSTANIAESKAVTVRGAQELRGIDIAMVASRASTVAGTIFDSRGRPASGAVVTVRPGGDPQSAMLAALNTAYIFVSTQPNGQFKLPSLLPGDYVLHAAVRAPDSKDQESADLPLTVREEDVEGLVVHASPNGRIAGRVVFEDEATADFAPATLRVTAEKSDVTQRPQSASVSTGWDFDITNVEPGRLTLTIGPMPAGWAVKRVVADGRDVTESFSFTMTAGGAAPVIEVTLTNKPTLVTGAVTQAGASPVPDDYTVVVFGDDPSLWLEGSRRVVTARPDQYGTYKLSGLPPGRYRGIAIDALDEGEQWNPEFLGWARARGTLIDLEDGGAVTLNLVVTKYTN